MLQVALLPGIFQWLNRLVLRAQRPDSRPSSRCSHGSQRSPLHQPAGPSQASTHCSGLIASMEPGFSSRSCREREGGT
jgi:hypothetical protein